MMDYDGPVKGDAMELFRHDRGGVGPQKHVLVTGTLQQLPGDSKCLVHPIVGGHLTP